MVDRERRLFVASVLSTGIGVGLAGCGSSGSTTPTDLEFPGDVVSINGVEITFRDYLLRSELSYVPRGSDEVTVADVAPNRESTTVTPREDSQFLVVVVEVANVSDEPKRVPIPGGSPISAGSVFLEVNGSKRSIVPVDPGGREPIAGAFRYEGEWVDRLTLAVGSCQSELPPNTAVTGWMLYEVGADFDPADGVLVARTNPEGPPNRYTWRFTTGRTDS